MKRLYASVILVSASLAVDAGTKPTRDPNLTSAGAPYAPLDVSRGSGDSNVTLSSSERDDLLSEFKGLVSVGLKTVAYERWGAKEMADCERPAADANPGWSYRCEIITGQGNGYYYFYPNETRQSATLQELDIRLHAADEKLLDDFRRPVQQLFGPASLVQAPSVRAKASSPVRRWNTENDLAELFIDRSVRPEGSVRFVWKRAPLVSSSHAALFDPQKNVQ